MRPILILALLTLTACGADGPPERPTTRDATPTDNVVSISGEAIIAVRTKL